MMDNTAESDDGSNTEDNASLKSNQPPFKGMDIESTIDDLIKSLSKNSVVPQTAVMIDMAAQMKSLFLLLQKIKQLYLVFKRYTTSDIFKIPDWLVISHDFT